LSCSGPGPAVVVILVDPFPVEQPGNALVSAQSWRHDPERVLCRTLSVYPSANVPDRRSTLVYRFGYIASPL